MIEQGEWIMPKRFLCALVVSIALSAWVLVGCDSAPVYSGPPIDSMTLYSLEGMFDPHKPRQTENDFHGFPVLGQLDIAAPKDKSAILAAIEKAIAEGARQSKCFWPRHGVR